MGEIIAGIIVGKSGFNWIQEGVALRILSELGFAYLMFLSGLEINFSAVLDNNSGHNQPQGTQMLLRNPMIVGSLLFILTLAGSTAGGFMMWSQNLIQSPWIMALVISTTSLGVVVPVLKERGITENHYGQSMLIAALVADFASILLISVYVLLRSQGPTLEILLVLVLFAAFIAIYRIAALFRDHLPAEQIIEEISSATSQIKLRGAFVLAFVFIVLAESLGIEIILGAFLAGVIVSLLSDGDGGTLLREKLDAIGYGFFIPIFFVMVGVGFNLPALLSSSSALVLVPLIIITAYLVKVIPALIYKAEYSWRKTLATGILLSARLSLIIAAAAIGLRLGIISGAVNAAIILVAVITCTASPVLFNLLIPRSDEARRPIIVVGSRTNAELLVNRLLERDLEAVLISSGDTKKEEQVLVTGESSPWPHQHLLDELRAANIEQAGALIAMEEKDEDNLRICRIGRRYDIPNIIARVYDPLKNDRFRKLGTRVINPVYSGILMVESMVLNPGSFSIAPDVDEVQQIREIKFQNTRLVGKRINDIDLPPNVVILMVERSHEILVPDRDTVLRANDTLTLVGSDRELGEAAQLLARNGRNKR